MARYYHVRASSFNGGLIFDDNNLCIKATPNLKDFIGFPGHLHPLWLIKAICFTKGWEIDEVQRQSQDKEVEL